MTAIQRALTQVKQGFQVVAPEQGLVNGWQDGAWGHYFTVDVTINTALGSDYDVLVIVGGERSVAKLKQNPHTRRIINHFLEAGKPVSAIGEGVALLALSPAIADRKVAADKSSREDLTAAKAVLCDAAQELSSSILTSDGTSVETWADATRTLIDTCALLDQAA